MSSLFLEKGDSLIVASKAVLLPEDREVASWANKYVYKNPGFKWILGNFAEADNPNRNMQLFPFTDLSSAQKSLDHTPLNLIHTKKAVGTFVKGEMIYPNKNEAAMNANPYLEALSVFWRYAFPDDFRMVEQAHDTGKLFYSMEAIPSSITCDGEAGCGEEFKYVGPKSDSYCEHLNNSVSEKRMNNPVFVGGALIIPPTEPGWSEAAIKELAAYVDDDSNSKVTQDLYNFLTDSAESESDLALTMHTLLTTFREL